MAQDSEVKQSFIHIPKESDFSIQNLPYGIFTEKTNQQARVGVAIGDMILDLAALERRGLLGVGHGEFVFNQPSLNKFMSLGENKWDATRDKIIELVSHDNPIIKDNVELYNECLIAQKNANMQLPVEIGDYTDFYSSEYHATNVGMLFRDKNNALLPNWKHLPVAYNGRASSVVISGTDIHRPRGQIKSDPDNPPIFAASKKLDFELEMGFFIGQGNSFGRPIPIQTAQDHIFGFVLVNDWSARDIQLWEYQPLGPFLSKIFATSISPWVVTAKALEPFKTAMPTQDPEPLPYLQQKNRFTYDINLEVQLKLFECDNLFTICQNNFRYMYWSTNQQLAHHTITGCNMRTGDLLASGSISGSEPGSYGSLLEITQNGKTPIHFPNGKVRGFLEDGDEVIMKAHCQGNGFKVGFGRLAGTILPAFDNK